MEMVPTLMAQMVEDLSKPEGHIDPFKLNHHLDVLLQLDYEHRTELDRYLNENDMSPIFQPLTKIGRGGLPAYCHIVKYLLDAITPQLCLDRHENNVLDALGDGIPEALQNLALQQLLRMAKDTQVCMQLAVNENILGMLVDRMVNFLIAPQAIVILLEITRRVPSAVKTLFSGEMLAKFQTVQEQDMVCRLRVYEVYCHVAIQSIDKSNLLKPQLDSIIEFFRSENRDVLVKCNLIELLTVLVSSKNTVQFVLLSGVITDLRNLLSDPNDKGAVHYMPGVLEFFGKFGENHPEEVCDNYTDCLRMMIQLSGNVQFQAPAMSNLGLIGRSHQGKRCMKRKLNLDMIDLMKNIGKIFEERGIPFKTQAALTALGHLMEVEDVEHRDLMPITLQWFSMAGDKPLQALWNCAKHLDEEVRILAYGVIRNIALLSWGRDALLEECSGFYEWILARDPEADKEELEAKFSVVAALHEQSSKIKDPEKRAALRIHVNDGPFYSSAEERLYYQD